MVDNLDGSNAIDLADQLLDLTCAASVRPTNHPLPIGVSMLCNLLRTWSRRMAVVTAVVSLVTMVSATPSAAENDTSVRVPEADYGVFRPGVRHFPAAGDTYNDPVFGTTVRRITDEYGDGGTSARSSRSDIYSKNGFWSADGKLMYHMTPSEEKTIINTKTGASVAVPGELGADYKGFDASFAPDDVGQRYTWYYLTGSTLMKYSISIDRHGAPFLTSDGGPNPALVKDFKDVRARALGRLGGSVDWIDNTGHHMVLNLDGKVRVWNNHTQKLYSGSVAAAGADWIGISPDGKYVVTATDKGFYSYAVDHGTGTLSTKGILFWTLCGGHGDLVSASDGQSYAVTFDCYGAGSPTDGFDKPAVYAVNVAPRTSVSGRTETSRNLQRRDPANKRLFQLEWQKSGDGHMAGVSKGPLRDWVFVSLEASTVTGTLVDGTTYEEGDILDTPVDTNWWNRPYIQEIVMANVVTREVRRLAHHRSRSIDNTYFYQPRVSAGWGSCDGPATVAWASNFGREAAWDAETGSYNYADIYAIDVAATTDEVAAAVEQKICP
jgi:hypothetical protein